MFTTEIEKKAYALKPMNCPGHVQIFNQGLRSYRNLPLRIAEFGHVHRYEPSGTLHGLMRVRRFTQDDAHVFCAEYQIQSEVENLIEMALKVYTDFGFDDIAVGLSTRPVKRVGRDELWDRAESALESVLTERSMNFKTYVGEGAFYGPKIDFVLNDCIGRKWQCGTIQLDFSMPARLGAQYVTADGSKKTPVMIHRAILGSLERFIGILIEEHAGRFPVWLAPVQAVVMNISEAQREYLGKIGVLLRKAGVRAILDSRNEKIGFKIREQTLQKIPFLLVVGNREVENESVAVRTLSGEDMGSLPIASVVKLISDACTVGKMNKTGD
jgi:threonyl-tRNA synthetase